MYILPQPYKCPKCGHEYQYSPHDGHEMPVFNAGPVCPRCWGEFVLSVVPIMDCVVRRSAAMLLTAPVGVHETDGGKEMTDAAIDKAMEQG